MSTRPECPRRHPRAQPLLRTDETRINSQLLLPSSCGTSSPSTCGHPSASTSSFSSCSPEYSSLYSVAISISSSAVAMSSAIKVQTKSSCIVSASSLRLWLVWIGIGGTAWPCCLVSLCVLNPVLLLSCLFQRVSLDSLRDLLPRWLMEPTRLVVMMTFAATSFATGRPFLKHV